MLIIYQNEDKKYKSKETSLVNFVICIEKISRYLEEEYNRRFGEQYLGVCNSRRLSYQPKTKI